MVSRVPRRTAESGGTFLMRLTLEPSSRILEITNGGSPTLVDHRGSRRYVACIVSLFGSQSSPFFHRRRVTEAIFRARVNLARSGLTPRAIEAS